MSHADDLDLVSVLVTTDQGLIDIAEGLLEGAGIPYLAKGEGIQDLFGLGRLTSFNPLIGPVEIQVTAQDAASAQELLADLLAPDAGD
jgi:hypothetical protein